ncbi:uncharacterized protein LOC144158762 [Haemaphysalis longicornis]
MNIYSSPASAKQKFKAVLHKACKTARPQDNLVVCGDFNAPNQAWSYGKTLTKGRDLLTDYTDAGLTLITDPSQPTRTGNSVSRDTTPNLTLVRAPKGKKEFEWHNTGQDLGSDHFIIEMKIPLRAETDKDDGEAWTNRILEGMVGATKEIETEEELETFDSRLAHLLEAKRSIQERWRKQRTNRRLRKKVAELNRAIEKHCRTLCRQQWFQTCSAADGQMHTGKTWAMLRHLLDETKTKSYQQHNLAKILNGAIRELGEEMVRRRINKYIPTSREESHPDYRGEANEKLDRDIEVWEVRAAVHELNCHSAAGPDKVTNKALKNLSETAIESLTALFNKCWKWGSIPKKWRTAKTILIPGKPPIIENLQPISMTSCVGKAIDHVLMNRSQRYLEEEDLFPESMLGFRGKLCTQDAMIQLKAEIIDDRTKTRDNKAVLGLDLQSAFDKVKHSSILAQVNKLDLGERS